MSGSKGSVENESTSPNARDGGLSGDESEDESEVLEESPCGRWQKRREEVQQRDVPGIDCAFLAMDSEQGIEVVWNEVCISEKKSSKSQEDKIKRVFDNLIQIEHANIVKFHKYWTDTKCDKPRVIFITEYMSSGSLKQFLKKTKKNNKTLKAWKRWSTQILSALSYLHSCDPPIIHGNLRTDTIFIQHNGLVKIGSVAPDAIYNVKTYRQEVKNLHYAAPEYGGNATVTTAVDIYSFGICALEMAALEIPGNGDTGKTVSEENIQKTIDSLEDPRQKDFIQCCLEKDPQRRPSARELLFHRVLFEVHSLKLLAAHTLVKHATYLEVAENRADQMTSLDSATVLAEIRIVEGQAKAQYTSAQVPKLELEKFLDDVRNGVFPLTAFATMTNAPVSRPRAMSPELPESVKSETPEPPELESRVVVNMQCQVKPTETTPLTYHLTIVMRMNDQMNRRLSCDFTDEEHPVTLAEELVKFGLIGPGDREKVISMIEDSIGNRAVPNGNQPVMVDQNA